MQKTVCTDVLHTVFDFITYSFFTYVPDSPAAAMLFLPPDKPIYDRYGYEKNQQTTPMLLYAQQIMAQPYLYDDGRNFAEGIGDKVIPVRNMAQGAEGRDDHIRRIGNHPADHNRPDTAVGIELFQHIAPANDLFSLIAQQRPRQAKADFDADDFSDPGNQNPRNQTKYDAVDRQKGDRGNTDGVDESNHKHAYAIAA